MRQVAKKGLLTMVATGGVLAVTGGAMAYADAGAAGAAVGSPGVLSGNNVQVPVNAPVNVCGNTVDVVGVLNPAFGNQCANTSSGLGAGSGATSGTGDHNGGGSTASSGSSGTLGSQSGGDTPGQDSHSGSQAGGGSTVGSGAHGTAAGSPGVGSGDQVQVPVHVPVNACGNSVNVVALLNPVFGNDCANQSGPAPQAPGTPQTPTTPTTPGTPVTHPGAPVAVPRVPHQAPPAARATLAHTGTDGLGFAASTAGALLLGGALLYRRGRAAARR